MVIAVMTSIIRLGMFPAHELASLQRSPSLSPFVNADTYSSPDQSFVDNSVTPYVEERSYFFAGNYKLILQTLPALSNGKLSKKIVDESIDSCSHIQNIRNMSFLNVL